MVFHQGHKRLGIFDHDTLLIETNEVRLNTESRTRRRPVARMHRVDSSPPISQNDGAALEVSSASDSIRHLSRGIDSPIRRVWTCFGVGNIIAGNVFLDSAPPFLLARRRPDATHPAHHRPYPCLSAADPVRSSKTSHPRLLSQGRRKWSSDAFIHRSFPLFRRLQLEDLRFIFFAKKLDFCCSTARENESFTGSGKYLAPLTVRAFIESDQNPRARAGWAGGPYRNRRRAPGCWDCRL